MLSLNFKWSLSLIWACVWPAVMKEVFRSFMLLKLAKPQQPDECNTNHEMYLKVHIIRKFIHKTIDSKLSISDVTILINIGLSWSCRRLPGGVPLICILSKDQQGWLHWFQTSDWLYVSLWENDPTSHLIYYLSKQFPNKFKVSVIWGLFS